MSKTSKRRVLIMAVLILMAITSSVWGLLIRLDWASFLLNLGTELTGAVVTYFLIGWVLGREEELEDLIQKMGSTVKDTAVSAADELRRRGHVSGGSLIGANLSGANLGGANLSDANLFGANLSGANLRRARFDETTILPDGAKWTADTNMERFANPKQNDDENENDDD